MTRLLALGAVVAVVASSTALGANYYPAASGLSRARTAQGARLLVSVTPGRRAGVRYRFDARCRSGRVQRATAAMAGLSVRRGEAAYGTLSGKLVTHPRGAGDRHITAVQRVVGLVQTPEALGYLSVSVTVRRAGRIVDRCFTGRVLWRTPGELFDSYAAGLLRLPS